MPTDDARAAATTRTTLSGSIIAAALAVLGAQAAIATFTLEKKQDLVPFYVCSGVASVLLLASMVAGALGITAVYKEGYTGAWGVVTGKKFFGPQAALAVGGAIAVLTSVYLGNFKPPDSPGGAKKIEEIERKIADLEKQVRSTAADVDAINQKLGEPATYDEEPRFRGIVEKVQGALKAKGLYLDGQVDALIGPKTRRALQEFQRREGLAVTGRIDGSTLKRLGP
jgi:hypothetical protein